MNIIKSIHSQIMPPVQRTDYLIGSNLLGNLHNIKVLNKQNFSSYLLLSDTTIFKLYGDKVTDSFKKIGKKVITSLIAPGEKQKSLLEISNIVKPFFEAGFDRNACLVALGGGVITDLCGFISTILLRGIPAIYLPTTLLGQIDAAIGGKAGIDFQLSNNVMLKNMIGTIKQPTAVISDIDTLSTLPKKEILNGLGEMTKYWIGWGKPTPQQMKAIKTPRGWPAGAATQARTPPMVKELIETVSLCQRIKIDIVQQDPMETKGVRQKLNLGHTIGHAIEGASDGTLSHGQAVAIGLAAAARISTLKGLLTKGKYQIIVKQLHYLGLPTNVKNIDKQKALQALKLDKKGGTFVLINDIGDIITGLNVEPNIINQVLPEVIV